MALFKLKKSFGRGTYNDAELLVFALSVIEKMTGNSYFTNPNPKLETIKTSYEEFQLAVSKHLKGNKESTAAKNAKRDVLEELLQRLANYVEDIAGNDEVILLSSGFELYKKAEKAGPLDIPQGLMLKPGTAHGSLVFSWDKVDNARSYEVQYYETEQGNVTAKLRTCTCSSIEITGLTSGKQYTFEVAGVGSDPSRNWSDTIASFVL
jgi:hypothetical protein